jgi:gluconate 5-dehydrogenase
MPATFSLTGRTAIITGASRGLGQIFGRALASAGADLVVTSRNVDDLTPFCHEIEELGRRALPLELDVRNQYSIERVCAAAIDACGHIDILVNNAGCNWAAPAETYPDSGWRKVMALNIDAAFFLSREIARRSMIPRRSGKVVNVASISALAGNPPQWELETAAYNASKGALVALTRALAAEWAPHNINVNAICPGFFPSKMTDATLHRVGNEILAMTPLGRLGGEEDLKGAVVFLASEASRHITGQVIAIDGGYTAI